MSEEQHIYEIMTNKRQLDDTCNSHSEWKNCEKPLANGSPATWTWSKRHRSEEVVLPEPTYRKGESECIDSLVRQTKTPYI